ncbi:MAG: response regulator transcription factor [Candidatus Limnocylindrales bacterium]
MVRAQAPDVVLMDIRMPRMNGLDATEQLCAQDRPPKVIVLTTFDADDYVLRALAAGASGFLLKDTAPQDIVDAVRRVAAGEPMLSPRVIARLIQQLTAGAAPDRVRTARQRLGRLTEREHEVAVAVGQGLTNAEIAARCTCPCPRSRRTSAGCSASWTPPTGCRSRSACTTPASAERRAGGRGRQVIIRAHQRLEEQS